MRSTKAMHEVASKYRGNILNELSWLEKLLDTYLTNYFTGGDEKKSLDMQLLVWGDSRIAFDNKRQIFHAIAFDTDFEWYLSYKSIKTHVPYTKKNNSIAMNKDLVFAIEQRNILAHCIIDTSDEARKDNSRLRFMRFKNDVQYFDFNDNSYSELMFIIKDLSNYFYKRISKK